MHDSAGIRNALGKALIEENGRSLVETYKQDKQYFLHLN